MVKSRKFGEYIFAADYRTVGLFPCEKKSCQSCGPLLNIFTEGYYAQYP